MSITMPSLTARRREFVRHYSICRNGAEAARRAGYSPRTADREGYRLLRNVEIRREIRLIEESSRKRTIATREEVLERLTAIMNSTIADFLTPDLRLDPRGLRDPMKAIGLQRFSHHPAKSPWFSLAMVDRLRAIDLMARMQGWYRKPKEPLADIPVVLQLYRFPSMDGTPFCAECFARRKGMRLQSVEIIGGS